MVAQHERAPYDIFCSYLFFNSAYTTPDFPNSTGKVGIQHNCHTETKGRRRRFDRTPVIRPPLRAVKFSLSEQSNALGRDKARQKAIMHRPICHNDTRALLVGISITVGFATLMPDCCQHGVHNVRFGRFRTGISIQGCKYSF